MVGLLRKAVILNATFPVTAICLVIQPPISLGPQSNQALFYTASTENLSNFGISTLEYPRPARYRPITLSSFRCATDAASRILHRISPDERNAYFTVGPKIPSQASCSRSNIRIVAQEAFQTPGDRSPVIQLHNREILLGIQIAWIVASSNRSGEPLTEQSWRMGCLDRATLRPKWAGFLLIERDLVDYQTYYGMEIQVGDGVEEEKMK